MVKKIGYIDIPEVPGTKIDDNVEEALKTVVDAINDVIAEVNKVSADLPSIKDTLKSLKNTVDNIDLPDLDDIKAAISSALTDVNKFITSVKDAAVQGVKDLDAARKKAISDIGDKIKDIAGEVKKQIDSARKQINDAVQDGITKARQVVSDARKDITNLVQDAMKNIKDMNIFDDIAAIVEKFIKDRLKIFFTVIAIIAVLVIISWIVIAIIGIAIWKNRQLIQDNLQKSQEMAQGYRSAETERNFQMLERGAGIAEKNPQTTETITRATVAGATGGTSEIGPAVAGKGVYP